MMRSTDQLFGFPRHIIFATGMIFIACESRTVPIRVASSTIITPPDEVALWQDPVWVDDDHLVLAFQPSRHTTRQDIGVYALSTSELHCLTCSLPPRVRQRPIPHPNGSELLFHSTPPDGSIWEIQTYVLSCDKPFATCDASTAREYLLEGLSAGEGTLQDRWATISPGGDRIAWTKVRTDGFLMLMGNLERPDGRFRVTRPRVVNLPVGVPENSSDDIRLRGAFYETKGFTNGGATLAFSATRDHALNLDEYLMDLANGNVTRHTFHPDWDEDAQWSPDGAWFATGTSRGQNVLEAFSTLPLAPFGDFMKTIPIVNFLLSGSDTNRHSTRRSAVLFTADGDRAGFSGVALDDNRDEWFSGPAGPRWAPNGRQLILGEFVPQSERRTRIRLVTLDRDAFTTQPAPVSPDLSWAPSLDAYPPRTPPATATISGEQGGSIQIAFTGSIIAGQLVIQYDGYTDDGIHIFNGTQQIRTNLTGASLSENIEMKGDQSGSLTVDLRVVDKVAEGHVQSTLDGRKIGRHF